MYSVLLQTFLIFNFYNKKSHTFQQNIAWLYSSAIFILVYAPVASSNAGFQPELTTNAIFLEILRSDLWSCDLHRNGNVTFASFTRWFVNLAFA